MEQCHNNWDLIAFEADVHTGAVVAKCPLHAPFHVCLAVTVPTLLSRLPRNLLVSWPPNAAADGG